MWSNVVEETGEPGENHRTWTGDHYPAICLDPDSNPDRRGDKRVRYPLRYPGPPFILLFFLNKHETNLKFFVHDGQNQLSFQ